MASGLSKSCLSPDMPVDILCIIAHPDDELLCAGIIAHHSREGKSAVITVANEFQGKKSGTLFMSIIIYVTKMSGRKTLWLTTSKDNKTARSLHKKLGFEDVDDKEVYVHGVNWIDTSQVYGEGH